MNWAFQFLRSEGSRPTPDGLGGGAGIVVLRRQVHSEALTYRTQIPVGIYTVLWRRRDDDLVLPAGAVPERRLPHVQLTARTSRLYPLLGGDDPVGLHAPCVHELVTVTRRVLGERTNGAGFARRHPVGLLLREAADDRLQYLECET
jgi:hypothetical protein